MYRAVQAEQCPKIKDVRGTWLSEVFTCGFSFGLEIALMKLVVPWQSSHVSKMLYKADWWTGKNIFVVISGYFPLPPLHSEDTSGL